MYYKKKLFYISRALNRVDFFFDMSGVAPKVCWNILLYVFFLCLLLLCNPISSAHEAYFLVNKPGIIKSLWGN